MNILAISDTHGAHNLIHPRFFNDVDVIIHAGDSCRSHYTGHADMSRFLKWFESIDVPCKIYVPGNHDFLPEQSPESFRAMLAKVAPSVTALVDESFTYRGYKFYGSPWSNQFGQWAFMDHDEALAEHWSTIPSDTQILITHGPALGTLDKVVRAPYPNVGSLSLAQHIEANLPNLAVHISGHIHEAYGIHFDSHLSICPSFMNEDYYPINSPIKFTLKDIHADQA